MTPGEIEKYMALLADTPRRIAGSTAGMDEAVLRAAPGPKTWSVVALLAHLRACDEVWSHTVYAMLLHEAPALPLFHPRDWAKAARYAAVDFQSSFEAFALKRAEYLGVLRRLPETAWERGANIGGRRHTVFSQVRRTALHEAQHCAQIEAAVRGRYMPPS